MNRQWSKSLLWLAAGVVLGGAFVGGGRRDTPAYAADGAAGATPLPPIFRAGVVLKNGARHYWIREVRGPWVRAAEGASGGAPDMWIHVPAVAEGWQLK